MARLQVAVGNKGSLKEEDNVFERLEWLLEVFLCQLSQHNLQRGREIIVESVKFNGFVMERDPD